MIFRPFRFVPLLVACSILTLAAPLRGAEVKYPDKGPSVTLTVPDAWNVSKKDGNVLIVSPDDKVGIMLSKSMAENNQPLKAITKAFAEGAGMKDIEVKEAPDTVEGDAKASVAIAMGKSDDKDFVATVMKLTTTGGVKVIIIAYGEKEAVLNNKEVDAIMNNIK